MVAERSSTVQLPVALNSTMATTLSHHLLCLQSPKSNPPYKSQTLTSRNPSFSVRHRALRKSSPQEDSSTSLQSSLPSLQEPKPNFTPEEKPVDDPPVRPSLFDSVSVRVRCLSDGILKFDELVPEILSIALPAALALAADPISSLVDTAFVGHIGSAELAAVGVSVSVFNLISKLFNVPLLNITTSFVAEEQATVQGNDNFLQKDFQKERQSKIYLPSVSTSLALASIIGIAETVALSLGSGFFMNIMGIPTDSPMWVPAQQFLTFRAFGAPAIVIALAAQGTYRGFLDTKTPLYSIAAGNLLNAILDPILIFIFGLGIGGAAIATVISEYVN